MHSPQQLDDYRQRLRGCWMGKNFGGAVGMPFEGWPGPRLDAAEPEIPELTPNDDLEMQLLAIAAMDATGRWPEPAQMSRLWLDCLGFAPDEYGIALRNLRDGILPPQSGGMDNWFVHGMGAVIRTEIWACLQPGDPAAAATLAANDSSIDHAGEGVHAAAFLAALQSAAFTGDDLETCLSAAAQCVPTDSGVLRVLDETAALAGPGFSDAEAVERVHARFGHPNFTDCLMNLAFILLALRRGAGEVRRSLHLALRCGEDADCTCASVAATLGILKGAALADEWRGLPENLVTSADFARLNPPDSVPQLVERIEALRERLAGCPVERWQPAGPVRTPVHRWLVLAAPTAEDLPAELAKAFDAPGQKSPLEVEFEGVYLSLEEHCSPRPVALHLAAWFSAPQDTDGWLLVAADAGITVWVDGRMVANSHSRKPMIPAFHRTEGGCCLPLSLKAGVSHRLHVRLLQPNAPYGFCATFGDGRGWQLPGLEFRAQP